MENKYFTNNNWMYQLKMELLLRKKKCYETISNNKIRIAIINNKLEEIKDYEGEVKS